MDVFEGYNRVVEDGYAFFEKRKEEMEMSLVCKSFLEWGLLVTIFSAPNYCGEFDNAAAVMIVSEDLTCSFKILKPMIPEPPKPLNSKGKLR